MTESEKNNIKSRLQEEALKCWKDCNYWAYIKACTGFGKSRAMTLAIKEVLAKPNANILVGVPNAPLRDVDIPAELTKWGVDPSLVTILCYKSFYGIEDQHYDLLVLDEFDVFLTELGLKFFDRNTVDSIIGLTASMNQEKEKLAERLQIPRCFNLTLTEAQKLGIINPIQIRVYHVPLSMENVLQGKYDYQRNENSLYAYYDKKINQIKSQIAEAFTRLENTTDSASRNAISLSIDALKKSKQYLESRGKYGNRAKFMYELRSNLSKCLRLKSNILSKGGRLLLFSQYTKTLDILSSHTYYGSTAKNKNLDAFNKKIINELAVTTKKVGRGVNFKGLNFAVGHSFTSSSAEFIQALLGRLSRLPVNEIGTLYLFTNYFKDSRGEDRDCINVQWFHNCVKELELQGEVLDIQHIKVPRHRLHETTSTSNS